MVLTTENKGERKRGRLAEYGEAERERNGNKEQKGERRGDPCANIVPHSAKCTLK